MDELRKALAELVRLKDLKDSYHYLPAWKYLTYAEQARADKARRAYEENQPLAWQAARTALAAPQPDDKRDGWVLVPREPTEAMMEAGDEACRDGLQKAALGIPYGLHPKHASWNVYKAMLAALQQQGSGKEEKC